MSLRFTHYGTLLTMIVLGACGCGPARPPAPVDRQIPAPKEPPPPPPARTEKLDPTLLTAARKELQSALGARDPLVRAHAIEAAQWALGREAKASFLRGLKDEAPPVRFASAMAIGQLQLAEAKDELVRMVNEQDQRVAIAVRFALHRLGDTRYSRDLQTCARDPQWQIRADTALVLGMLGEPSATRVLKAMVKDPEAAVRIQVAEAMWRLGSEEGLRALVAATQSGYPDDQMVALMALAAPRDRRVLGHLRAGLTADYIEVQLIAARAMGLLGSDGGYAIAVEGTRSKDARQRVLAALALGAIGRSDTQKYLSPLLNDQQSGDVRLAAAQAILQLQNVAATP